MPLAREDLDSNYVVLAKCEGALVRAAHLGQHGRSRRHGGIVGEAAASFARDAASMPEKTIGCPEGYNEGERNTVLAITWILLPPPRAALAKVRCEHATARINV